MRFWAYVHDLDGDLVKDLGEFAQFGDAMDATLAEIKVNRLFPDMDVMQLVYRIIDSDDDIQTVWIAGPVSYIGSVR